MVCQLKSWKNTCERFILFKWQNYKCTRSQPSLKRFDNKFACRKINSNKVYYLPYIRCQQTHNLTYTFCAFNVLRNKLLHRFLEIKCSCLRSRPQIQRETKASDRTSLVATSLQTFDIKKILRVCCCQLLDDGDNYLNKFE